MNPLETYLKELSEIRASGAAVKETSYYGPLANLLNEIGKTLKPKVKCIINLQDQGIGLPDEGLPRPPGPAHGLMIYYPRLRNL